MADESGWGTLRPETEAQRKAGTRIGEGDIEELRSRMAALSHPGEILDEKGNVKVTSAALTRALMAATVKGNG